jgi:hypothetical protein
MNNDWKWRMGAFAVVAASISFGQPGYPRQATMVGGGGPDRGKCTIEVVVDDVAQVEIRGATAWLRTVSGQPAQWRRFECNGALPPNPVDFRFAGVDGRGRQMLVRDPRSNGGTAVVQIEDKDGGAEGYTFDIFWGGFGGGPGPGPGVGRPDDPMYRPNYRDSDYYRRYRHGFGVDEAVSLCQQAVLRQATRRFRTNDVHFHRTSIDDGPGRQDWVVGTLDVHRRAGEERFRFSCSVDFESGRIRSADIDPRPLPDDPRWH